jgi:hypothetical protein
MLRTLVTPVELLLRRPLQRLEFLFSSLATKTQRPKEAKGFVSLSALAPLWH